MQNPVVDITVSDFGELRLIKEIILNSVVGKASEKHDDCAHIEISAQHLLWSIDPCPTPVAHWFDMDSPDVWGHYTATINLSDIAASGGTPIGMLTSLELPDDTPIQTVKEFQGGLTAALAASGAGLLGGNLKSAKKFSATGTIIGYRGQNNITRHITSTDCSVYLVGNSGDFWSAIVGNHFGWGIVSNEMQATLNKALCFPKAQTDAGKILGQLPFEIACMDCSDGPANALYQLSTANSLDIKVFENPDWQLNEECIQLLNENSINIENACYQFGDWQLLCIIPKENNKIFEDKLKAFNVTEIGNTKKGTGSVSHEDGRLLATSSLNQNFSGGYNSVENIEDLISKFLRKPIFI